MYARLIFKNMKRSVKDYLIYLVTMTVCVTLFYAFLSISSNDYDPPIGAEYDFTMLSDGMKLTVCAVALLLLFLIRFVSRYMLKSRSKEFAVQAVLGMEQRAIAGMFFAETFFMGMIALVFGIVLGAFGSQFITAMAMDSYGKEYELVWTLFPDTVLWTVGFFALSFGVVGFTSAHTLQKSKTIELFSAEKRNEADVRTGRFMPVIIGMYAVIMIWALISGIRKVYFYYDPRLIFPAKLVFLGIAFVPGMMLLGNGIFLFRKRLQKAVVYSMICSIIHIVTVACVPKMQQNFVFFGGAGALNEFMMFLLADLIFLVCALMYLAGSMITVWKEHFPHCKYAGTNLFFFGQILSKLRTTTKTMTLICLTLVLSIVLFISSIVLSEWALGYLDIRSLYDIQISSRYNDTTDESQIKETGYENVTDFLEENEIETTHDCLFSLYLPERNTFHDRVKWEFPVTAMALSDYNAVREMVGFPEIRLDDGGFAMQWQTVATEEEREAFVMEHREVQTDAGTLKLAENAVYQDAIGETVYNSYTNVIYIFPDAVCDRLLSVGQNRYIQTKETVTFEQARKLEALFTELYPEEPISGEGMNYYIRLKTLQVNSTIASNFLMKAMMIYGAIVLMVICLTILSLQQLLDAAHYKYRFGVLLKLGVERKEIRRLILKQLGVWFGIPIGTALMISAVFLIYFIGTVAAQIDAYIGSAELIRQIGVTVGVLLALLFCYFGVTWILFQKNIE